MNITFLFLLRIYYLLSRFPANLLVPLCVMFSCDFVTFACGVLGQVWYLIVSISDHCLLTYLTFLDFNDRKMCWPDEMLLNLIWVFTVCKRDIYGARGLTLCILETPKQVLWQRMKPYLYVWESLSEYKGLMKH